MTFPTVPLWFDAFEPVCHFLWHTLCDPIRCLDQKYWELEAWKRNICIRLHEQYKQVLTSRLISKVLHVANTFYLISVKDTRVRILFGLLFFIHKYSDNYQKSGQNGNLVLTNLRRLVQLLFTSIKTQEPFKSFLISIPFQCFGILEKQK